MYALCQCSSPTHMIRLVTTVAPFCRWKTEPGKVKYIAQSHTGLSLRSARLQSLWSCLQCGTASRPPSFRGKQGSLMGRTRTWDLEDALYRPPSPPFLTKEVEKVQFSDKKQLPSLSGEQSQTQNLLRARLAVFHFCLEPSPHTRSCRNNFATSMRLGSLSRLELIPERVAC